MAYYSSIWRVTSLSIISEVSEKSSEADEDTCQGYKSKNSTKPSSQISSPFSEAMCATFDQEQIPRFNLDATDMKLPPRKRRTRSVGSSDNYLNSSIRMSKQGSIVSGNNVGCSCACHIFQ